MSHRNIFAGLVFFVMLMALCTNMASAQKNKYWHNNDYYSVELDGEGDAFVLLQIKIEAISDEDVSYISLEIPNRNVHVYKVLEMHSAVNYGDRYYGGMKPKFIDFETERLSDSTKLTLPLYYGVIPNEYTQIAIIYSTNDIAQKEFRGLNFNFETVKDPNALIRNVGANVYVPENMQLKGKPKFDISYKPTDLLDMAKTASTESIAPMMYELSRRYGNYQYNAKNLDPGESFTISGIYGGSFFKLYIYEIIAGIIALIVALVILRAIHIVKRIKGLFRPKEPPTPKEEGSKGGVERGGKREEIEADFSIGRPLFMGLVSGFFTFLALLISMLLFGLVNNIRYPLQPVVGIFVIIIDAIMILLALFGPAYYLYKRYSFKEGLISLIVGMIIAVLIIVGIGLSTISYISYSTPLKMTGMME